MNEGKPEELVLRSRKTGKRFIVWFTKNYSPNKSSKGPSVMDLYYTLLHNEEALKGDIIDIHEIREIVRKRSKKDAR